MLHAIIERTNSKFFDRAAPPSRPSSAGIAAPRLAFPAPFGSGVAVRRDLRRDRWTTMLHDLMPDIVTVSFGARTREIHKRLRSRGWRSVGLGDWQGERVLGVSFGGDRRATRTADDLLAALIAVTGEMHIAETRAW